MGIQNHRKENHACHMPSPHLSIEIPDDIIQPKRLTNPVQESPSRRSLHRELLFSHRSYEAMAQKRRKPICGLCGQTERGLLLGEQPELLRVLQQRRLEQLAPPASDLELELRKRKQRLQKHEQEELKRLEDQDIPEFVQVKENLRHIPVAVQ